MPPQPQFNFKKITVKEAKRLIKEYNGTEDEEHSKKYLTSIFILNDGKTIQLFDTHAFLYESLNEILRYWEYLDSKVNQNRVTHILKDKLLYNRDFADHEGELVHNAIIAFKLVDTQPSSEGVKKIDEFINRNKRIIITASIYSQILAYVGRVMQDNLPESEWRIINREDDKSIFEPYISSKNKLYNPFFFVYKELYESLPEENKVNLYDSMIAEIGK